MHHARKSTCVSIYMCILMHICTTNVHQNTRATQFCVVCRMAIYSTLLHTAQELTATTQYRSKTLNGTQKNVTVI